MRLAPDSATTREQIIAAADTLFYQHGFEHASFTDIAAAVGISRGNFYYHFKTKDDILAAVIASRLVRTQALLAGWAADNDAPAVRIRCFINLLIANREPIMRYGCPVGTLCAELAKLGHLAHADASKLYTLFRDWLACQFHAAGRGAEADTLAMHLLMRSQGVAALAQSFHDEDFIRREVAAMHAWLDVQLAMS
ncbi:transcriptional regulator, TetR family [Andreprevotia lacus DSM 23236]|jgi:AcrR family transcriptional regulator|uniref:Transcriptional regulator, TetR family n=1 Tax=Andreprevotia lacus DSM 23236 TaxID=1121001 RepID=A0A1W1XCG9_9NEIS|nr:TetR/AcrR family transcriptional regulator [Andreprevotia lacus]SMC21388.1 transcriptional regulator, TetR family [Andreprevotia lacus DSM 23236]